MYMLVELMNSDELALVFQSWILVTQFNPSLPHRLIFMQRDPEAGLSPKAEQI